MSKHSHIFLAVTGLFILAGAAIAGGTETPRPPSLGALLPFVKSETEAAIRFMDENWDDAAGLTGRGNSHGTRASAQYAAALLLRNGTGDGERVRRIVENLARLQVDAPQSSDHGTWPRRAEEHSTLPARNSPPNLDPNWREFIGCVQVLLLEDFSPLLDAQTIALLEQCIRRAAAGDHERRVRPQYSNIALMSAHLLNWAGKRFDVRAWQDHGRELAEAVHRNFMAHGSLDEYNSPTYGGVDLFGMGLWRAHPVTPEMGRMGREMEDGFWRDLSDFYHAGMRNLCGPYDRAYGMDMQQYVALAGVWIGFCVPEPLAPVPAAGTKAVKDDEWFATATYALVFREPSPEVLARLREFKGDRLLRRPIGNGGGRVAAAWLSKDLMVGGGVTPPFKNSPEQAHPVTAHWAAPDGGICWMRLRGDFSVEAAAGRNTLAIKCTKYFGVKRGDSILFEIHAPGARADTVAGGAWHLPGLDVQVSTDLAAPTVSITAQGLEISYPVDDKAREAKLELTFARSGSSS